MMAALAIRPLFARIALVPATGQRLNMIDHSRRFDGRRPFPVFLNKRTSSKLVGISLRRQAASHDPLIAQRSTLDEFGTKTPELVVCYRPRFL